MLRWLLFCLISTIMAAEPSRPSLPDPYGLGERLVMIDHLRQRRIPIPADASDEQIHTLFRQLSTPTVRSTAKVPALIDGVVDEGARRQDHIIRLRRVLSERFTFAASEELDEDELNALVASLTQREANRTQETIAQLVEQERQRAAAEDSAATLITRIDAPSGVTWHLPRLTTDYEARHSPYVACLFGSHRDDGVTVLQLRLVVFMPKPPAGEPTITLHAGDHHLRLEGFSLHAVASESGSLRAEAEVAVGSDDLRDALREIINHGNPCVEYRFGAMQLQVPITADQRQAIRHVLAAYAAAQSSSTP